MSRRAPIVIGGLMFLCGLAASCSDSTAVTAVDLSGHYSLRSFTEGGTDLSQAASGTAVLTGTTYKVDIVFTNDVSPEIVDSGTYSAKSDGTFSETSLVTGAQSTGTYTDTNGIWSVNVTSQGVAITQSWQTAQ